MPEPNSSTPQPGPAPVQPAPVAPEPIEPQPIEPEPVSLEPAVEPVPISAGEVPAVVDDEADEPISLVETEGNDGMSRIRAGGARSPLDQGQHEYARKLNTTGTGATRCRLFHSRVAIAPLEHMQRSINEWIDSDESIDIKHVGHLIGIMEGKSPEPNLIVFTWY